MKGVILSWALGLCVGVAQVHAGAVMDTEVNLSVLTSSNITIPVCWEAKNAQLIYDIAQREGVEIAESYYLKPWLLMNVCFLATGDPSLQWRVKCVEWSDRCGSIPLSFGKTEIVYGVLAPRQ